MGDTCHSLLSFMSRVKAEKKGAKKPEFKFCKWPALPYNITPHWYSHHQRK